MTLELNRAPRRRKCKFSPPQGKKLVMLLYRLCMREGILKNIVLTSVKFGRFIGFSAAFMSMAL
jgi:hypothetical protein